MFGLRECQGERRLADEGLHPRAAKYRAERYRDVLSHLHLATNALRLLRQETASLEDLVKRYRIELERLLGQAGQRIEPRKRPRIRIDDSRPREEYFLFLDECGSHTATTRSTNFPVFCLCGVVIPGRSYEQVDLAWKTWKQGALGGKSVIVHEPDVRHRNRGFRGNSREHADELIADLDGFLAGLDCRVIAAAVDFREFEVQYPEAIVDNFLPGSCSFMSIDFVLERFLHYLQHQEPGARGLVVAESRGLREDAQVHAEFIRLQLEGTQFIPDTSFRACLRPYMEFHRKTQPHWIAARRPGGAPAG